MKSKETNLNNKSQEYTHMSRVHPTKVQITTKRKRVLGISNMEKLSKNLKCKADSWDFSKIRILWLL